MSLIRWWRWRRQRPGLERAAMIAEWHELNSTDAGQREAFAVLALRLWAEYRGEFR